MQKGRGKLLMLLLVCSLVAGCGKEASLSASWEEESTEENTADPEADAETEEEPDEESDRIYVQILGAVKKPGVYEVPENSRLFQVLELAGGFTDEACTESVNQAGIVTDEQQIYVYSREEAEKMQMETSTGQKMDADEGKVNLNSADRQQLMTLPGIGESKAESILKYREDMGKFSSIEEIMKVDGIKEGVYNKIKEQITI
ncbi:MAG: helix-hairpin-helix domain-containing protein [Lachnospiraceae bacterium]